MFHSLYMLSSNSHHACFRRPSGAYSNEAEAKMYAKLRMVRQLLPPRITY